MALRAKLEKILGTHETFKLRSIENGFEIKIGDMYDAPELTFDMLSKLSKLFGTTHIDVDNYSRTGCDTCDYGSDYGHEIQITHPTKLKDAVTLFAKE